MSCCDGCLEVQQLKIEKKNRKEKKKDSVSVRGQASAGWIVARAGELSEVL